MLVVYTLYERASRESVSDHLRAFGRYSERPCSYLNLALHRAPRMLHRMDFDLVVFHTTFLSKRASREYWELMLARARPLKGLGRVRAALPQDEYLPPAPLCEFIEEFEIDHVFSVAPPSEWPAIYPSIDRGRVRLSRVLTGYLAPDAGERAATLGATTGSRPIDIGYRAKQLPAWLGRHAVAKAQLADAVAAAAPRHGLRADVSTRPEDTLLGEDWLRFLASCRYTIGAEGGASLLDPDGSVRERVERYVAEHPHATYDQIEAACFPGRDGSFGLVALSPRHLEACATRTCQVLIEGDYNGVLEANRHYIPLRADLGNLDEVLAGLDQEDRREAIVEAAYADIVASGNYTYRRLIEQIQAAVGTVGPPGVRTPRTRLLGLAWAAFQRLSRLELALRVRVGTVLRAARRRA